MELEDQVEHLLLKLHNLEKLKMSEDEIAEKDLRYRERKVSLPAARWQTLKQHELVLN